MSTRVDLKRIQYCENHDAHWIPTLGQSEKASSCPWCQRDSLYKELDQIAQTFRDVINVKQKQKGGMQVPYHGDFANSSPSSLRDMEWYLRKWDPILNVNKTIKRGF